MPRSAHVADGEGGVMNNPGNYFTGIVDFFAGDGAYDLDDVARGGIVAAFAKCSEGVTIQDRGYVDAMVRLKAAGMLRGAYHFGKGTSDAEEQARVYCDDLRAIVDDPDDILPCLDLEGDPKLHGTMSTADAARFITSVRARLGRWPVLYMGLSKGRARMRVATQHERETLTRCPLWLAAYGEMPAPDAVPGWSAWSLWQYTNGVDGPHDRVHFPRLTDGFLHREKQDRSSFRGTAAELRTWWSTCGR